MAKNEMIVATQDGDMKICVMDITPKKAAEFLTLNEKNRNLRVRRVNLYAEEMVNNNWMANGVPIVIGNDGVLKDGQHRLKACMKSGKTMKNTVVIYLPQKQANCFDLGANRTAKDVAMFANMDDVPYFRNNNMFSAVHTAIEGQKASNGYSKIRLLSEMKKHEEACAYIYHKIICKNSSTPQNRKLRKAPLLAAIFNAYINEYDRDKMDRFCDVLTTGFTENDTEFVIAKLREMVIVSNDLGKSDREELYLKAQQALYSYANNEVVKNIGKNTKEYYPYSFKKNQK